MDFRITDQTLNACGSKCLDLAADFAARSLRTHDPRRTPTHPVENYDLSARAGKRAF